MSEIGLRTLVYTKKKHMTVKKVYVHKKKHIIVEKKEYGTALSSVFSLIGKVYNVRG